MRLSGRPSRLLRAIIALGIAALMVALWLSQHSSSSSNLASIDSFSRQQQLSSNEPAQDAHGERSDVQAAFDQPEQLDGAGAQVKSAQQEKGQPGLSRVAAVAFVAAIDGAVMPASDSIKTLLDQTSSLACDPDLSDLLYTLFWKSPNPEDREAVIKQFEQRAVTSSSSDVKLLNSNGCFEHAMTFPDKFDFLAGYQNIPDLEALSDLAATSNIDLNVFVVVDSDALARTLELVPGNYTGITIRILSDLLLEMTQQLEGIDDSHTALHCCITEQSTVFAKQSPHTVNPATHAWHVGVRRLLDVCRRRANWHVLSADGSVVQAGLESSPTIVLPAFEPVPRTVVSDSKRFLFVAGLEGTGHHMFMYLFRRLTVSKSPVAPFVSNYPELCVLAGDLVGTTRPRTPATPDTAPEIAAELVRQLRCLAFDPDCAIGQAGTQGARLYRLSMVFRPSKPIGMMSYPNFPGTYKPFQHPDVYQMALLHAQAKVDFRVIVLLRHPAASLVSTIVNRNFGRFDEQLHTLTLNADMLLQQLKSIDRQYFICIEFEQDLDDFCDPIDNFLSATPLGVCDILHQLRKEHEEKNPGKLKEHKQDPLARFSDAQRFAMRHVLKTYQETRALCNLS